MQIDTKKLLTPEKAAPLMGLSVRRVQKLCSQNRLGIKIGRAYFITAAQARRFRPNPPGRPAQARKAGNSR